MKKFLKIIPAVFSLIIPVFFCFQAHADTLVAGHAEWMPWCWTEKTGDKGILIDIFKKACEQAGIPSATINIPIKRRNELEWGKRVNVELGVIPEWREKYKDVSLYTIPVFRTVNVVLAKKGKMPKTDRVEDFFGKTLGTNRGFIYTDGFTEAFEQKKITRMDTVEGSAIIKMMVHDRFDAAILDRYEARYCLKSMNLNVEDFEEVYIFKTVTDLRFRLHKSQKHLLEKLDKTLKKMKEDGSIQQIVDKYTK